MRFFDCRGIYDQNAVRNVENEEILLEIQHNE